MDDRYSQRPTVWRRRLQKAELKGQNSLFFEALLQVDGGVRLSEFVSDLREDGYSVRTIMLDPNEVLRYRVFLPAGSRMEDDG